MAAGCFQPPAAAEGWYWLISGLVLTQARAQFADPVAWSDSSSATAAAAAVDSAAAALLSTLLPALALQLVAPAEFAVPRLAAL